MSYLLDTDIVSNPLKKTPSPSLLRRLATVPAEDQFSSTITVGEMVYGALRSARAAEILERLDCEVWPNIQIVTFDVEAAREYGRLRAHLEGIGTPISEPDLRIAAIAVARGMILVTGNERHFRRIDGLSVENWLV